MAAEKPKPSLDIEQLKKKHGELLRQKTTAEAHLQSANQQLEDLKKEAQAKYGTADLEQLKKKLQEMKEENERRRAKYQADLELIETRLAQVEKDFTQ